MKTSSRPIMILFILTSILLFVIGIRLGKKIQQVDLETQINSLKQKNIKPTIAPFTVKKFISAPCGVQFLYPGVFKEYEQSTDEARLTYQNQVISLHCNSSKIIGFNDLKASMKSRGTRKIDEIEISLYESEVSDNDYLYFTHPKNKKNILMRLPRSLWDLFETTVKFL